MAEDFCTIINTHTHTHTYVYTSTSEKLQDGVCSAIYGKKRDKWIGLLSNIIIKLCWQLGFSWLSLHPSLSSIALCRACRRCGNVELMKICSCLVGQHWCVQVKGSIDERHLWVCPCFIFINYLKPCNCLQIISVWLEYLIPYSCVQIICIKNSYLKLSSSLSNRSDTRASLVLSPFVPIINRVRLVSQNASSVHTELM